MIISPTEPSALRTLGFVSMKPEDFGCDLLFASNGAWAGIQRKEFKDLVGSVEDGRLGEQIQKMVAAPLEYRMVVVEGNGRWGDEGELMSAFGRGINRSSLRKLLWSVRREGVWIEWSDGLDDTVGLVRAFEEWCGKRKHDGLRGRPGARSAWGTANSREWVEHFLQGLPGVGPELAGRLVEQFGGSPVGWREGIGVKELMSVEGIGKVKAEKLMKALEADRD